MTDEPKPEVSTEQGSMEQSASPPEAVIRFAQEKDTPVILHLIRQKAEFDRGMSAFSGALEVTEERIIQTLFCLQPFASVLLAEFEGKAVGFALFYYRYSSFKGQPSLWLDDLFVSPEFRNHRIGTKLMRRLARMASHYDSSHIAWTASANNRDGIRFYRRLGAEVVDQKGALLTFQANPIVYEKWGD